MVCYSVVHVDTFKVTMIFDIDPERQVFAEERERVRML